jgi:rhomboid family protein
MLSDRDYMNRGGQREPQNVNRENPNMCIYVLIAINAIVFFAIPQNVDLFLRLALSSIGIKAEMYWQIVTSMFLHGGLWHLFFNMWALYLLGTLVLPYLKTARFLSMYFISGICGSLLWLFFNWSTMGLAIGASGALFGVLAATAMFEPNREFLILFSPTPLKAKTLLIAAPIIPLLFELFGVKIAHSAHIGGMIGGYIYIRVFCSKTIVWDPVIAFISLFYKKKFTGTKTSSKGWTVSAKPLKFKTKDFNFEDKDLSTPVSQKELDYLLDKVSKNGINSLSEAEMATLRQAREQMRKR